MIFLADVVERGEADFFVAGGGHWRGHGTAVRVINYVVIIRGI